MSIDLGKLTVLGTMDDGQRAALADVLTERTLAAGEPLFRQNDAADSCFLIISGDVVVDIEIEGKGAERVSTLTAGDLFGEVALLDGRPRSATCTAGAQGVHLAVLAGADFDALFSGGDRLAQAVMDIILDRLVRRLRGATQLLLQVTSGI